MLKFNGDKTPSKKLSKRMEVKIRVTKEMHNLGIPIHIKGFDYAREAIILVIEDRKNMEGITKILYPRVAKIFDSTATRVERAIRHAIEVGCNRCSADKLDEMFKDTIRADKGKPTNSEFIATVADKIRLEMEEEEDDDDLGKGK